MARSTVTVTLGQSLGEGQYNSSASTGVNALSQSTTADSAVATSQSLEAAVTSAVSAAAANATIAGNGTALALVQAIQTAFNLLIAQQVTAKAATLAAKTGGNSADLILDINTAVLTTKNSIRAAVQKALQLIQGSNIVTS